MEEPNRPVTGYPAPNPQHNGYPPSSAANPPSSGTAYPYSAANPPPAGAAYPYSAAAAPPSNAYYYQNNPYQHQNNQYNADSVRRATCIRRIFAFMIGLVVIFGTITFIVWLVLRPQLPEFRVDSFSISNFSLGNDSLLFFNSEVKLTARNPNKKMKLAYDSIETAIYYKSYSLSDTSVAPFYQDTKSETSLTAKFAAAGSFVDKQVVDGINSEKGNNGVNFNLRLLSRVRFEAKAWKTRRRFLKVFCGDLIVGLPSNGKPGSLTGGMKQCRVGI